MRAPPASRAMAGALAVVAAALAMAACGGDEQDADLPPARPLVASGCSPIEYGGEAARIA